MTPKLFTLAEANSLLPTLEPLMRRLQAKRQEVPASETQLQGDVNKAKAAKLAREVALAS